YAALFAGLSGWFYAHYLRFVSPSAFNVNAGIDYLFMAVIGGTGHVWGAVIGASILTFLKEYLKGMVPSGLGASGNYEIVVFGVLMMLLLHRASSGLAPVFARWAIRPHRRHIALEAPARARRGIARTFQHVNLVGTMSVLENVALGAHLRGRRGTLRAMLRAERAEEAQLLAEAARQVERVGLTAQLHDAAGSLPLGQQRLVEIARALSADPTLLLFDEPAAGLRYAEKQALAALLRRLRGEAMSILLVEHDMEFVMGL